MNAIERALRDAYVSLENPRLDFAKRQYDLRPYGDLVTVLQSSFRVSESTDLNDDVCVWIALTSEHGEWALLLSLVGSFALVLRMDSATGCRRVITESTEGLCPEETQIVVELQNRGIAPLAEDVLNQPIGLALANMPPTEVRVFHALFSRTESLPWQQ
jgi:hypothetical protein